MSIGEKNFISLTVDSRYAGRMQRKLLYRARLDRPDVLARYDEAASTLKYRRWAKVILQVDGVRYRVHTQGSDAFGRHYLGVEPL
jgi:hypothetical protein